VVGGKRPRLRRVLDLEPAVGVGRVGLDGGYVGAGYLGGGVGFCYVSVYFFRGDGWLAW